ncbi:MAG: sugar phosphate isomerase/epimerase [Oscillospiraceae bacterium]|nr:sugar phosphate isomerase/epimerase [Oscillospiraceae bacterium]
MMIKYGFQTYTWQMSYEKYAGKMEHIADIAAKGKMGAIEAEICMLKEYFDAPEKLQELFAEKNIDFCALCLVCDWLGPKENEEEKFLADKALKYLRLFPGAILALCQMPQKNRENLAMRQKNALGNLNEIAKRAQSAGTACVFHPNSPAGSVFRTYDDYRLMLDGLDARQIGFAPDSGHIIKGGMNARDIFADYAAIIKHVHFKDIDAGGNWKLMGEGMTDFPEIIEILKNKGYGGYIMVEDESPEAETNPDAAALKNSEYLRKVCLKI